MSSLPLRRMQQQYQCQHTTVEERYLLALLVQNTKVHILTHAVAAASPYATTVPAAAAYYGGGGVYDYTQQAHTQHLQQAHTQQAEMPGELPPPAYAPA